MSTSACPPDFRPTRFITGLDLLIDPVVMGLAFAATRDVVSYLRYDTSSANPLIARAGRDPQPNAIRRAIMFGRSQSGRFAKDFVYQGFNQDETKRIVFDGTIELTGGGRMTNVNSEFSMPGRFSNGTRRALHAGRPVSIYLRDADRSGERPHQRPARTLPRAGHVPENHALGRAPSRGARAPRCAHQPPAKPMCASPPTCACTISPAPSMCPQAGQPRGASARIRRTRINTAKPRVRCSMQ